MSNNSITYRQIGIYLFPNLTLPSEEANIRLSKWGMMHKDNLQKHKAVIFNSLLMQGKLWRYLADIDSQAQKMFYVLVKQMKEKGITEELKKDNQMQWIGKINIIQSRATGLVNQELIYI